MSQFRVFDEGLQQLKDTMVCDPLTSSELDKLNIQLQKKPTSKLKLASLFKLAIKIIQQMNILLQTFIVYLIFFNLILLSIINTFFSSFHFMETGAAPTGYQIMMSLLNV